MTLSVWDVLRNHLDPPDPDVFGKMGYTPSECQQQFHDATEFDVGFGGRAGTGKSKALIMEALRQGMRYPGLRIGGFRRTYGELEESLIKELIKIDFAKKLGCKWNGGSHELKFPNGSLMRLLYAESVPDAARRQGGEYQLMLFDERQMVHPDVPDFLINTRVRSGDAGIPVIGVRSTFNPGGLGHTFNKIRYIERTDFGKHSYEELDDDDQPTGQWVRFVEGIPSEHVDPDYWRRLRLLGDPKKRRQLLDGDWESPEGAMFSQFRHRIHVCSPEDRPIHMPTAPKAVGVDWGRAAPFAAVWVAKPADDIFVVYRELAKKELTRDEQADLILASESNVEINPKHIPVFLDPSCWNRDPDSVKRPGAPLKSTASIYQSHGLPVQHADNRRIEGWQLIHDLLAVDRENIPRLIIYDTCPQLIRCMQDLPRDVRNPDDVDTHADDHLADALRYALMGIMYKRHQKGDGRQTVLPKPTFAGIRHKQF